MMNIVKTDIKNMQDIAPLIDDDIIELYNAKYRRYKRVKKPNFVNGLTEVKINPYNNEREYEFASRQGSREASPNNDAQDDNAPPSSFPPSSQHPPQLRDDDDDDDRSIDPIQHVNMDNNNNTFGNEIQVNTIIPANLAARSTTVSPATSVRSTASLQLGQIQVDDSGRQVVNM
jgi:hypothetical protein